MRVYDIHDFLHATHGMGKVTVLKWEGKEAQILVSISTAKTKRSSALNELSIPLYVILRVFENLSLSPCKAGRRLCCNKVELETARR